jgi:hypothetical protein
VLGGCGALLGLGDSPAISDPGDVDVPDATTPEATKPEATTPEAMTPEATTPEAMTPEAMTPEATTSDVMTGDVTTDQADDGNPPTTDAADSAPPPLPSVESGHLQLWLTADRGVSCTNGEVVAWADQSGHGRPVIRGSHKGPQCPPTDHALAGVNLPYFSAPGTTPPFDDETLDVDLSFLANTDFTIFVVERRWADANRDMQIIGTEYPQRQYTSCPAAGHQIDLGYVYYDGYPALNFESVCYLPYSGTRGEVRPVPPQPPIAASYDMVRLSQASAPSPTVWWNGVQVNVGGATGGPGSGFSGGGIGRALAVDTDERFIGDIAEVVVFDAGLSDPERVQIETYFKTHWQLP